jgi:hypothetical protein
MQTALSSHQPYRADLKEGAGRTIANLPFIHVFRPVIDHE